MKLLYYIPSIGGPNLDKKFEYLEYNLNHIHNNIGNNFDIISNNYSDFDKINNFIGRFSFISNYYNLDKEGILTELWLNNPYNYLIRNYDYVIFVLDDVKIIDLDIEKLIQIKDKYSFNILSPRVINSTHSFMYRYSCLTINNSLEVYFLLMCPDDFYKYASMNTIENKWMWGVDFLFGFFNLKVGVYNKYNVKHMLKSNSNQTEARKLCDNYINSHGFKTLGHVLRTYPHIKDRIINEN